MNRTSGTERGQHKQRGSDVLEDRTASTQGAADSSLSCQRLSRKYEQVLKFVRVEWSVVLEEKKTIKKNHTENRISHKKCTCDWWWSAESSVVVYVFFLKKKEKKKCSGIMTVLGAECAWAKLCSSCGGASNWQGCGRAGGRQAGCRHYCCWPSSSRRNWKTEEKSLLA